MGRDKARLRLGRRTLLGHVRALAGETGLRVRIVRRDLVPRCGPLGGVYTALKRSRAEAVLFLSCDMPFVSHELLAKLLTRYATRREALFVEAEGTVGFPFVLPRAVLPLVEAQLAAKRFSLQALAATLTARRLKLRRAAAEQLFNVNTPEDFGAAVKLWRDGSGS